MLLELLRLKNVMSASEKREAECAPHWAWRPGIRKAVDTHGGIPIMKCARERDCKLCQAQLVGEF